MKFYNQNSVLLETQTETDTGNSGFMSFSATIKNGTTSKIITDIYIDGTKETTYEHIIRNLDDDKTITNLENATEGEKQVAFAIILIFGLVIIGVVNEKIKKGTGLLAGMGFFAIWGNALPIFYLITVVLFIIQITLVVLKRVMRK